MTPLSERRVMHVAAVDIDIVFMVTVFMDGRNY
jgi:hypothetical protein